MSAAQTAQTCQIVRNKSILKHLTIQKKLVSSFPNSPNLSVTLRGPEHCLTENRQHASQTVADKNCYNLVLDKPVDKSVNNTANDDTEIVHLNTKSADECALTILIGNRHHKADTTKHCGTQVLVNVLSLLIVIKASPQNRKLNYTPAA